MVKYNERGYVKSFSVGDLKENEQIDKAGRLLGTRKDEGLITEIKKTSTNKVV